MGDPIDGAWLFHIWFGAPWQIYDSIGPPREPTDVQLAIGCAAALIQLGVVIGGLYMLSRAQSRQKT